MPERRGAHPYQALTPDVVMDALYSVGLVLAVLLEMMKIPPLAFAIGMYLPLQINTPLFIGGLISHFVSKSSRDPKVAEARVQKPILQPYFFGTPADEFTPYHKVP